MRTVLLAAHLLAGISPAMAQVQDHLKCYRMTDPLQLEGVVDLDAAQFGLDKDCKVSRAKLFCVPTQKAVVIARNGKTGERIETLPVTGPGAGDRICYKVRCPARTVPNPEVSDQFGTRTIGPRRVQFLCTPAMKGAPTTTTTTTIPPACGNFVLDAGEECDDFFGPPESCCNAATCRYASAGTACIRNCSGGGVCAASACTGDSAACPIPDRECEPDATFDEYPDIQCRRYMCLFCSCYTFQPYEPRPQGTPCPGGQCDGNGTCVNTSVP